jgi:predicted TIM-barrel fold metal-dependent hydrolase
LTELDVPVGFHSGAGTPLDVGVNSFHDWAAGRGVAAFALGYMLVSMAMIGGGVLERFPQLRVVFLEAGCGWLPYMLDRMQSGIQGSNRSAARFIPMQGLTMHPADYFRRQCFVASDPDDPDIGYAIEQLGDECIVTATDFGHPEGRGYMQAIDETLALETLSDDSRRRIMWDNPARLYGLE